MDSLGLIFSVNYGYFALFVLVLGILIYLYLSLTDKDKLVNYLDTNDWRSSGEIMTHLSWKGIEWSFLQESWVNWQLRQLLKKGLIVKTYDKNVPVFRLKYGRH